MKVEMIMSKQPVSVALDTSLKEVREIFDKARFHHLLVVESGKLFGVVSDRDLLRAISPNLGTVSETQRDLATLNKRVHQILTRKPITLSPESDVYEAIHIFNNHNISCIPIVDEENKPRGLLSWRDILRALEEKRG
ncbi:MAG: CBS domain-containing protein [Gammaproteobacteria bacterium]|nr:CBS domain-containing protein [Gammaproteobacteria bacterium]